MKCGCSPSSSTSKSLGLSLKNVYFPGKAELRVKKEDTLNAMRLVRACQKSIAVKGPVTMET